MTTYTAGTADGMVRASNVTWSTARSATTGSVYNAVTDSYIGSFISGGTYYIHRYMATFNTGGIPDTAIIDVAYYKTYQVGDSGAGNILGIYEWTGGTIVAAEDFDDFGTTSFGTFTCNSIGWKTGTLNSDGRDFINKTGNTNLFLRDNYDYGNTAPVAVNISTHRHAESVSFEPYLDITYYYADLSSHSSQFDLYKEIVSTHESQVLLYKEIISTHESQFLLWAEDTSIHESQFTLYDELTSSHESQFTLYPTAVTFESHLNDASVYKSDNTWTGTRDATTGDGTSTDLRIQTSELLGSYTVQRFYLAFDTSLMVDPTIYWAKLRLKTTSETPDNTPDIIAQGWDTTDTTVSINDFDEILNDITDNAITISATETWYEIDLNQDGFDIVEADGYTYIVLREYTHDHQNSAPSSGNGYEAVFYDSESSYEPQLQISYHNNYVSSHVSQFTLLESGEKSTHESQFLLYIGVEVSHYSQFYLFTPSVHQSQFTLYTETLTTHESQFTLISASRHYSQFYIETAQGISSHLSEFSLISYADEIQATNIDKYVNMLYDKYPEWIRPQSGDLGQVTKAIAQELYPMIQLMQHILELQMYDTAYVAANDGSELTKNTQLDYLFSIINRERYTDGETDSDLRDRIEVFASDFLGGGKLDQYTWDITLKNPTVEESTIKIYEPSNPYPNENEIFVSRIEEQKSDSAFYIERPPDQFGWTGEDTIKYYWEGGTPSGTGDWRPFKLVDYLDLATFNVDILNTQSATIGSEEMAIQIMVDDKSPTPFSDLRIIDNLSASSGSFYKDWNDYELGILSYYSNIDDIYDDTNPFEIAKSSQNTNILYNESFVNYFQPYSRHYSQTTLWATAFSTHESQMSLEKFATRSHESQFSFWAEEVSSHESTFLLSHVIVKHYSQFALVAENTYYVSTEDASVERESSSNWADAIDIPKTYNGTGEYNTIKVATSYTSVLPLWINLRGFIAFDTSSLPNDCTIISAVLSLRSKTIANSPEIKLYDWTGEPVVGVDDYRLWGSLLSSNTNHITITNQWYYWTLNSTGIGLIDKYGFTGYCLRDSEYDVGATSPADGVTESAEFYDSSSATYKPRLVIQYS